MRWLGEFSPGWRQEAAGNAGARNCGQIEVTPVADLIFLFRHKRARIRANFVGVDVGFLAEHVDGMQMQVHPPLGFRAYSGLSGLVRCKGTADKTWQFEEVEGP